MLNAASTTGMAEAIQQGLLLGAVLATIVLAGLTVWLRSQRTERTVTSRAGDHEESGMPDPCDPTVALARLRFAQGEIGAEDLRRVLQALSRTWQA